MSGKFFLIFNNSFKPIYSKRYIYSSLSKSASSYIVSFKRDTPQDVIDAEKKRVQDTGAIIKHEYNTAIKGFSVEVPDNIVTSLSFDHPQVDYVEADGEVTTQGKALLTPN